jgi:hypothetical protein
MEGSQQAEALSQKNLIAPERTRIVLLRAGKEAVVPRE